MYSYLQLDNNEWAIDAVKKLVTVYCLHAQQI